MRCVCATLLAVFVLARAAAPCAAQVAIAPAYAQALRDFNPSLSADRALFLADHLIHEADAEALDARLLVALIAVESRWRPRALSSAGAVGLGQLMPATAAELGVDPSDAEANIHGVAVYVRALLQRYRRYDPQTQYVLAISAYNAGCGAVEKYGGVPPYPETQHYVRAVISLWRRLAGQS